MNFDYDKLDTETRVALERHEERFKGYRYDAERNLRQMGYELTTIRKLLLYKNPGFIAWCVTVKFPVSTAYKLIKIVTDPKNVSPGGNILMLPALSEPQTPTEAKMQIEDAAGSKEIVEAVVDGAITPLSLAMAATNDPEPDTINVNGSGETLTEVVTSGYVSLKDGSQVEPTSEAVIQSAHAHMSERNARKGQHMDDSKASKITLPTNDVEEAARRILDSFAPEQITELLTILSSAVAERD